MGPSGWQTQSVIDLQAAGVLLVEDGNHGEYRPRPHEFTECGVAFIRAADMDSGSILFETASKISGVARARITKGIGAGGDVVLSHKGTVGKVALAPLNSPPFVCSPQTTFWRTLDDRVLDRRYLHAFLRSPGFHEQLRTRSGETDMAPYVSLTSQRALLVTLPPIDVQRAIAAVIGSLDDKIELNRRMNETLEAMARALFKSWFVDFDPVRAKAEGRQPSGMDAETAKLFPSEFEQSELGEIPKGWRAAPLSEWVTALSGGTPSKGRAEYWDGPLPWISPKVMTSIHADEAEDFVTSAALGNGTRLAARGSTLVMVRGMGLHQEVRVSQALGDVAFNQDVKALLPERISAVLLLFSMLEAQRDLLSRVESSGHGTGTLPTSTLMSRCIVMPPRDVQEKLGASFDAVNSRIAVGRAESRTLRELRDALLPRLLGGDLILDDRSFTSGRCV